MSRKNRKLSKSSQKADKKVDGSFNPESDRISKRFIWAGWVFAVLSGVLFSLKSLREPDLWWMFRTGEWILHNLQVPKVDHFSYTMNGNEWINVKWGFEVLVTLFQMAGGAEFVFALQALITISILLLLFKIYNYFRSSLFSANYSKSLPFIGLILASYLGLIAMEFRMNGRPEMISHFFVTLYFLFLIQYKHNPGKHIYWLVLFQVIWTNFHEAYGTGIVMLGAFTVGCWIDHWFSQKKSFGDLTFKPIYLTFTLFLAILAMAINPRGIEMIWHPWNIFNQLGANKYTTELLSFTHPNYWHYQAYLNCVFFVISLIFLFLRFPGKNEKKPWYLRPIINTGTGYILFLLMFFYLSLTAYRNIPFFILTSIPILAVGIDRVGNYLNTIIGFYRKKPALSTRVSYGILTILGLIIYINIASGNYYETFDRNDKFGLQIDAVKNPVGVTRFIKEHDIEGRAFADYLTSSYLMWKLRPDFKTFIDLRDLDVFPPELFNRFAQVVKYPSVFNQADSLYNFDYVVLYRPQFSNLHSHLVQSRKYVPVFVDPVAALYLKNKGRYRQIIQDHGFKQGKNDIFHPTEPVKVSTSAQVVNKLFWPFHKPDDYQKTNFSAFAASYYMTINHLELAYKKAQKAINFPHQKEKGHVMMGNLFLKYAQQATNQNKRRENYRYAFTHYKKALKIDKENSTTLENLGWLSMNFGNLEQAETYLRRAIFESPGSFNAYQYMAQLYRQKANRNSLRRNELLLQRLKYLQKAHKIDRDNLQVTLRLGVGYCQMDKCRKARKYLFEIKQRGRAQLQGHTRRIFRECLNPTWPFKSFLPQNFGYLFN